MKAFTCWQKPSATASRQSHRSQPVRGGALRPTRLAHCPNYLNYTSWHKRQAQFILHSPSHGDDKMNLKARIGARVQELRQAKGWTQQELGAEAGLDPATI